MKSNVAVIPVEMKPLRFHRIVGKEERPLRFLSGELDLDAGKRTLIFSFETPLSNGIDAILGDIVLFIKKTWGLSSACMHDIAIKLEQALDFQRLSAPYVMVFISSSC